MSDRALCCNYCNSKMIKRKDGEYYCIKWHWYLSWLHTRSMNGGWYAIDHNPKRQEIKYHLYKTCLFRCFRNLVKHFNKKGQHTFEK